MASDDKAPKASHHITLTRAALYILEGCLQQPGPATTNPKVVLFSKVWSKIRSANNRLIKVAWKPEGHDFEKTMFRDESESDIAFEKRKAQWSEATKAWEDEIVTLTMNDKMRDACREVVEWIHSHREDQKVPIKLAGQHAACLLVGLGICKAEVDADFELEVV